MIILVYADCGEQQRLIRHAVGNAYELLDALEPCPRLSAATREALGAIVFACTGARIRMHTYALGRLSREYPLVPLILVTDRNIEAVRTTSALRLSHIAWLDDLGRALRPAIDESIRENGLGAMIGATQRAHLPPLLKRALTLALRETRQIPFQSVKDLADATCCSPITLSHEFSDAVNGALTLSHFLGALQLMRARELRSTMGWERAAEDICISARTLRRKSHALVGCTLRDLKTVSPRMLWDLLRVEWLDPVVEQSAKQSANPPKSSFGATSPLGATSP